MISGKKTDGNNMNKLIKTQSELKRLKAIINEKTT